MCFFFCTFQNVEVGRMVRNKHKPSQYFAHSLVLGRHTGMCFSCFSLSTTICMYIWEVFVSLLFLYFSHIRCCLKTAPKTRVAYGSELSAQFCLSHWVDEMKERIYSYVVVIGRLRALCGQKNYARNTTHYSQSNNNNSCSSREGKIFNKKKISQLFLMPFDHICSGSFPTLNQ